MIQIRTLPTIKYGLSKHSCVDYKTSSSADRSYRADDNLFVVDKCKHDDIRRARRYDFLCLLIALVGISAAALTGCGVTFNSSAAQIITFTASPPASAPYNGQFTVAASSTSGLPVTFTSSGACTNSGATYTMTSGGGVCSIIASQTGNANHAAAKQVIQTVAATLAAQTITFTQDPPASAPYNGQFTVAASANSGMAVTFSSSGACTNSGAAYTVTSSAGVCSVIASQTGNANYEASQAGHPDRRRDSRPADHYLHPKPSSQRSLQQPVHRGGQR